MVDVGHPLPVCIAVPMNVWPYMYSNPVTWGGGTGRIGTWALQVSSMGHLRGLKVLFPTSYMSSQQTLFEMLAYFYCESQKDLFSLIS